ncbi:aldehyde dehydrogenase type III isoform X2 [Brevipalpus obovatus]|uniref:aldehyde dehydrogenase type III isoform X2 n=1 Tax=Brevipalpus obovatus TaxID=246614 RepID=UPI003D9E0C18
MENNNQSKPFGMLARARKAFSSNVTKDVAFRKKQLKSLRSMLIENEQLMVDALVSDLRKSRFETVLYEVDLVKNEIQVMLNNIDTWSKPQSASKSLMTLFDKVSVKYEPYGVVLIIGAWNYPIQLSLGPLVGAIAAGNCAILKPSELTPKIARVISELLPRYLDKECYHILLGGPADTAEALKERYDYIFYTGGDRVGRIIYEAAAKNLTPVTLEMGGKCPVYIDETTADMMPAVRRIVWGKSINSGQTCVAPDYIICTKEVQKQILDKIPVAVKEFFGVNPQQSKDLARVVNENHFKRLVEVLDANKSKIAFGGNYDPEDLYVSLTVISDVNAKDPVMQEEIFGPILPIFTVRDAQEAIEYINSRQKPLALYVFSKKKAVVAQFNEQTSSGALVVNDIAVHLTVDSLPFGGVGNSGMGCYHGEYTFKTFSHPKAVLKRGFNSVLETLGSFRYPPYSNKKLGFMRLLLAKRRLIPDSLDYVIVFLSGMMALMMIPTRLLKWLKG